MQSGGSRLSAGGGRQRWVHLWSRSLTITQLCNDQTFGCRLGRQGARLRYGV